MKTFVALAFECMVCYLNTLFINVSAKSLGMSILANVAKSKVNLQTFCALLKCCDFVT